jgi:hypothetical protein
LIFAVRVTILFFGNKILCHPTQEINAKSKDKAQHRTGHEGAEGEQRYSSTTSLISALYGGCSQCHIPAALPPGKRLVRILKDLGLDRAPVWTCEENFAPTGIRYPVSPAHSKSLFRLSYPGPWKLIIL